MAENPCRTSHYGQKPPSWNRGIENSFLWGEKSLICNNPIQIKPCLWHLQQKRPISEGPFTESMLSFTTSHSFLLSDTTPVNLLGRDLLCKLNCTIYCSPDGIFLETNQHNTTAVLAALIDQNQPICEEKGKVYDRVVSSVPLSVWATSSNYVGLIKTAEPVQILLKQNVSLPRIS